jgi:hypothetical protein
VNTEHSGREADSNRIGSPVRAAALLLALYAAMHLTVGGLLHVLTPTAAIAAVPADASTECSTAGPGATQPAVPDDSSASQRDIYAHSI